MDRNDESPRARNLRVVTAAEESGQTTFDALPLRLTLELTVDCNLRCPHCEFTPARAAGRRIDASSIKELGADELEMLAEAIFPHIQMLIPSVVGEPMMYSHWGRLLELLARYGVFLDICTNGSYLDREALDRMAPRLARLNVSMDGASPATFNKLRAPADFDDIVRRMTVVRDWRRERTPAERPEVWITSVLTTQWIHELSDMVRLGAELEVDGVGCGHLVGYNGHWQQFQPDAEPERVDEHLRRAAATAREVGISLSLPRLFGGEDLSHRAPAKLANIPRVPVPVEPADGRPYFCRYLWRELFVSLGGDVSSCCGLGRPTVGNLREDFDLQKHFQNPVTAAMRAGTLDGELHPACAKCPQLAMFGKASYDDVSFQGKYAALDGSKARRKGKGD